VLELITEISMDIALSLGEFAENAREGATLSGRAYTGKRGRSSRIFCQSSFGELVVVDS
jgi:hypothetical protein